MVVNNVWARVVCVLGPLLTGHILKCVVFGKMHSCYPRAGGEEMKWTGSGKGERDGVGVGKSCLVAPCMRMRGGCTKESKRVVDY